MQYYEFYWKNGDHDLLEGANIPDAYLKAGYGRGSIKALVFTTAYSRDVLYKWNQDTKSWYKIGAIEAISNKASRNIGKVYKFFSSAVHFCKSAKLFVRMYLDGFYFSEMSHFEKDGRWGFYRFNNGSDNCGLFDIDYSFKYDRTGYWHVHGADFRMEVELPKQFNPKSGEYEISGQDRTVKRIIRAFVEGLREGLKKENK